MVNRNSMVESLGYIGGQNEDLGGYCEPLVIRVGDEEIYVLHTMSQYRDPESINWGKVRERDKVERIRSKHRKVEFRTRRELISAFRKVKKRLGVDEDLPWVETNSTCGYDISLEKFNAVRVDGVS